MALNDKIKSAVDITQRAQRNYDLSKSIPQDDLDTLIYAAKNSPSKQNETHFSLYVYTDEDIIQQIYSHTKHHAIFDRQNFDEVFKEIDGRFWQDQNWCVTNSQILANLVFVYVDDNDHNPVGGTHILAQKNKEKNSESYELYLEQKNFSIGISVGELLLSASLLGYKTGCCSAFNKIEMQNILHLKNTPKLIVGVGFANEGIDRRLHPHVFNKDIPERFRTGNPNENWRFRTHDKNIKVFLNNKQR